MSAETPVITNLLNSAATLARSVAGVRSVFLNPENYAVWENAEKPVCLLFQDVEKPKAMNMRRQCKFELNFELYMQSSDKNMSSAILDKMYSELNVKMFSPDNQMFAYMKHVEELQCGKILGYNDLVGLVNIYEIEYFTLRGNPYQVMK